MIVLAAHRVPWHRSNAGIRAVVEITVSRYGRPIDSHNNAQNDSIWSARRRRTPKSDGLKRAAILGRSSR